VSFLLKWLGLSTGRPSGIAVRPARTFEVPYGFDATYGRCIAALEHAVGANLREVDAQRGYVEATFGLMFSERIACSLERLGPERTRVTLESRRIAANELPKDSLVLQRLAEAISGV
jgi:hypothetical protein